MRAGQRLLFGELQATIVAVDVVAPRLVQLCFDRAGPSLWRALYEHGRPVQYSYLDDALELWDVQTSFAARPWAVEPPSAGLALRWDLLLALRRRGLAIARITHAAGLSSTGDDELDGRLPFAERFDVPEATVRAVAVARSGGGRVIAAGTTVVRALESAALDGALAPRSGWTELRLGAGSTLRVCDGLLTGMHEEGTSHFELLTSFADRELLRRANAVATASGFRGHEFGDLMLIIGLTRHGACPPVAAAADFATS